MRVLVMLLALLCVLVANVKNAGADDWPARPIKLVVPYSAGGSGDIVAREIAQKLPAYLGRSVYVENRPCASGNIGTESYCLIE